MTQLVPDTRIMSADPPTEARWRIGALVDAGSFCEFGSQVRHRTTAFGMDRKRPAGDGVITGYAHISGRPVGLFAQDATVLGGSLGEMHASKIVRVLDYAERVRAPVIGLIDSGGARIQEGVAALDGYGKIFRGNVLLSGRVPQLSVVLGPCAGGAAYSPALTDILIMLRDRAHLFLTGPRVVQAVTRESVTAGELGGADADAVFCWPDAEIGVMGAEGAADVIFRRELAADPSRRAALIERYRADTCRNRGSSKLAGVVFLAGRQA